MSYHSPILCLEHRCVPARPSVHHMRYWKRSAEVAWATSPFFPRSLIMRECEHGLKHPDPDSLTELVRVGGRHFHNCDGCCRLYPLDEVLDDLGQIADL